jgi:hypothetical protein
MNICIVFKQHSFQDDIIVLQDPKDVETKKLANFHYIKEGLSGKKKIIVVYL